MSSNEQYPNVKTGPWHLERGLRFLEEAHRVLKSHGSTPADIQAATLGAAIGRGHIATATALVFATLAADEELGEPWAALVDPAGVLRAAAERRRADRVAEESAKFQSERAQREADHQRHLAELRAIVGDPDEPVRYTPVGWPAGVSLPYGYNPGPLVPAVDRDRDPGLSDEQIRQAGRELADSLINDEEL